MRYQVFYCNENNVLETGVAEVSLEYLVEFSKGKIILKIIPFDSE